MSGWKLCTVTLLLLLLGFAKDHTEEVRALEAQISAMSQAQVAREGKTDKAYQAKNPLPLSATSTRVKDATQAQAQEANRQCGPAR